MEENEQKLNDQLNGVEEETKAEEIEEPKEEEIEETVEEPEEIEEEPEEKQLTAAEKRFQKLANERAEEKAKREAAEREREFYRTRLELMERQNQKPAEEENLDPDEKWRRDANRTIQQVQLQTQDLTDRSAFMSKYARDPEIAAMHDQIEAKLAEVRKQGHNPPRENVLTFLLGQMALEKRAAIPGIKKEAAARVKAAQAKPLGTKSNVAATKSESTEYERLKDIPL